MTRPRLRARRGRPHHRAAADKDDTPFLRGRVPPGYPAALARQVLLADGRHAQLRAILPSDVGELRRALQTADPETLRRRFLGGRPPYKDSELARLTCVDYVSRLAVVAFDDDMHGIGIARYEGRPGADSAEVAVVVDPAWRHVGLATELLRALADRAVEVGLRTFTAEFFADNIDVRNLLEESGRPVERGTTRDGTTSALVRLPELPP